MEFIKADEFLKQPVEVQKVLLEWWKCDNGDLYVDNREYKLEKNYCDINCVNINLEGDIEGDWEYFKTISTPIFSEGQLRQFIEDKTGNKVSVIYEGIDNGYKIKGFWFPIPTHNLLQAYWKVATQIAKEE